MRSDAGLCVQISADVDECLAQADEAVCAVLDGHEDEIDALLGRWQPLLDEWIATARPGRRVLLLPPDYSRCLSYCGELCSALYHRLKDEHEVCVMPAVGTHEQMTDDEKAIVKAGCLINYNRVD